MPRLNQRNGPRPGEVGPRIRAERLRLGMTQEQAAERLGVKRGSYNQLEDAKANPKLSTLIALVRVVGMDPRAIAPELFGP